MAFIMATNSIIGFDGYSLGAVSFSVNNAYFNDTYVNSAIYLVDATSRVTKTLDTPISEMWFHFEVAFFTGALSSHDQAFAIIAGPTHDLFRLLPTDNVYTAQYWNGAAWVSFGSTHLINAATKTTIDIHVKLDNSAGVFEWYVNETLVGSFAGDTILSTDTTASRVILDNPVTSTPTAEPMISQCVIADESTIGCKVFQHTLTANGANTGWDGPGYTGYNMGARSTVQQDTALHTGTANAIETAVPDDLLATGLYIRGVAVNACARRSGDALTKVDPVLRSGGTNYFGTEKSIGYGNTHAQHIWATDPATAAAWDSTGVNQIEAGVRAKA
jgi:hypothetical protein